MCSGIFVVVRDRRAPDGDTGPYRDTRSGCAGIGDIRLRQAICRDRADWRGVGTQAVVIVRHLVLVEESSGLCFVELALNCERVSMALATGRIKVV